MYALHQPPTAWNMLKVAAALIPLSQALYANGDLEPARETCTRALKILQMAYGQSPSVEVSNTPSARHSSRIFFYVNAVRLHLGGHREHLLGS